MACDHSLHIQYTCNIDNISLGVITWHFYEVESISNQPNLFPVEIHLFSFDVIAL